MKLEIQNLSKSYGEKKALSHVSLTLTPGVYGLLGPNGAGKSTLMNIITDNVRLDSGEICFNGESIFKMGKRFRKILGYMPQQQELYPSFTGWRFLNYMAALKGMTKEQAKQEILQTAKLVNLDGDLNRRLGGYSGGMKQRILIAQAILNRPQVLILDEPTAGLDPKERIRIRNLISKIALDKIVLIATHVVSDIEYIAKEIILLKKGEVLSQKEPSALAEELSGHVFVVSAPPERVGELQEAYRVSNLAREGDRVLVRLLSQTPPKDYPNQSVSPTVEDCYLYHFEEEGESLS